MSHPATTTRPAHEGDRESIRDALLACGVFDAAEVAVAMEVFDGGLASGLDGDYPHFVAESGGNVVGYVCVGKTPMTLSTWDLYWICVHPSAQGGGVGRALQEQAEKFVRSRGGERIVLETSGRPDYAATHRFYQSCGYVEAGRIADFYKPGDDCVYLCKLLNATRRTSAVYLGSD